MWVCASAVVAVGGMILIFVLWGERGRQIEGAHSQNLKQETPKFDAAGAGQSVRVPLQSTETERGSPGPIRICVTDADTGLGIRGALLFGDFAERRGAVSGRANAENPITATDAEGNCEFKITPPALLTIRARGYVPVSLRFRESEALPREYAVSMQAGLSIGGYVQDSEGNPINHAKISIEVRKPVQGTERPEARELTTPVLTTGSDASGKWNCSEIDPGFGVVNLRLAHPEYQECGYSTWAGIAAQGRDAPRIVAREALEAATAVFVMDYGLQVAGIVTSQGGTPVSNAKIGILQIGDRRPRPAASSAADGRFTISNARRGEVTLTVQADGFSPERRTLAVVPSMKEVEFRLQPGQIVSGRIISEDGSPVAGAKIATAQLSDALPFLWEGKSDSNGYFVRDSAPMEPMSYVIEAEGYRSTGAPFVMKPGPAHEIVLHRLLSVKFSGMVVDSGTRKPIERFTVLALAPSEYVVASATGENGRFVLSLNDRNPNYGIRIEADGYLPDTSCSVDVRDGDRYVEIALKRGDGLRGVIALPGGTPVPEADLFLFGASRAIETMTASERMRVVAMISGIRRVRSAVGPSYSDYTTSDSGGVFSFAPMVGSHSVIATHEAGFAFVPVTSQEGTLKIILQPWGRIEGTLSLGNLPAGGQIIQLRTSLETGRAPVYLTQLRSSTNENGEFVFEKVPPGEYVVAHVLSDGKPGASVQVSVNAGKTSSVTLGVKKELPLRPQRLSHVPLDFHHLRTYDGREVDLLIEMVGGFIAIEIKAGPQIRPEYADITSRKNEPQGPLRPPSLIICSQSSLRSLHS